MNPRILGWSSAFALVVGSAHQLQFVVGRAHPARERHQPVTCSGQVWTVAIARWLRRARASRSEPVETENGRGVIAWRTPDRVGIQREDRGGWKIEVASGVGSSKVSSTHRAEESSGSTGNGSTARPQSSERGGGCGLDVEGGADLFEHDGPEQGLGRGT